MGQAIYLFDSLYNVCANLIRSLHTPPPLHKQPPCPM